MQDHAIVSCDYEEWKVDTYKGFLVKLPDGRVQRFFSDRPGADQRRASMFCLDRGLQPIFSSSVDHFWMDMEGGR